MQLLHATENTVFDHVHALLHIWQGYFGAQGPGFGWQSFAFNSTSGEVQICTSMNYGCDNFVYLWLLNNVSWLMCCYMGRNNSDVIWVEGYPSMLSKTTMCFKILLRITSVTTILGTFNISILFANVIKAVASTSGLVHSTQNLC